MKCFLLVAVLGIGSLYGVVAPAAAPTSADQVCAACHGADGNSPLPANPKLAGQHSAYLAKQLSEFKSGKRNNPVMAGMVANLSAADVASLAALYAGQKPAAGAAHDMDQAVLGQRIYRGGIPEKGVPACSSCHAPNGAGIPSLYPRLGGQHSEYTSAQLRTFRSGDRSNDENGAMRAIAARLSDREIAQLADYIAGLH